MSHCTTHSFEIICRGWKVGLASINSTYIYIAIQYNVSYKYNLRHAASGSRTFGSVVRALDFYPGNPGSNPMRDVGFFQTMHHFLVTNFHIRKKGYTFFVTFDPQHTLWVLVRTALARWF